MENYRIFAGSNWEDLQGDNIFINPNIDKDSIFIDNLDQIFDEITSHNKFVEFYNKEKNNVVEQIIERLEKTKAFEKYIISLTRKNTEASLLEAINVTIKNQELIQKIAEKCYKKLTVNENFFETFLLSFNKLINKEKYQKYVEQRFTRKLYHIVIISETEKYTNVQKKYLNYHNIEFEVMSDKSSNVDILNRDENFKYLIIVKDTTFFDVNALLSILETNELDYAGLISVEYFKIGLQQSGSFFTGELLVLSKRLIDNHFTKNSFIPNSRLDICIGFIYAELPSYYIKLELEIEFIRDIQYCEFIKKLEFIPSLELQVLAIKTRSNFFEIDKILEKHQSCLHISKCENYAILNSVCGKTYFSTFCNGRILNFIKDNDINFCSLENYDVIFNEDDEYVNTNNNFKLLISINKQNFENEMIMGDFFVYTQERRKIVECLLITGLSNKTMLLEKLKHDSDIDFFVLIEFNRKLEMIDDEEHLLEKTEKIFSKEIFDEFRHKTLYGSIDQDIQIDTKKIYAFLIECFDSVEKLKLSNEDIVIFSEINAQFDKRVISSLRILDLNTPLTLVQRIDGERVYCSNVYNYAIYKDLGPLDCKLKSWKRKINCGTYSI